MAATLLLDTRSGTGQCWKDRVEAVGDVHRPGVALRAVGRMTASSDAMSYVYLRCISRTTSSPGVAGRGLDAADRFSVVPLLLGTRQPWKPVRRPDGVSPVQRRVKRSLASRRTSGIPPGRAGRSSPPPKEDAMKRFPSVGACLFLVVRCPRGARRPKSRRPSRPVGNRPGSRRPPSPICKSSSRRTAVSRPMRTNPCPACGRPTPP